METETDADDPFAIEETTEPKREEDFIEVARKSLIEAVPDSACALAGKAREGSVPHFKLLVQLIGLDKGRLACRDAGPQERSILETVMERWAREP